MRTKAKIAIGLLTPILIAGGAATFSLTERGQSTLSRIKTYLNPANIADTIPTPSPLPTRQPSNTNTGNVAGTDTTTAPKTDPSTILNQITAPQQTSNHLITTDQLQSPKVQLTDDEQQVINFINRIIGTYNQLAPNVNMESLSTCITTIEIAIANIETCRQVAQNGLALMTALQNEAEALEKAGPFTLTNQDYLGQQTVNQSIYIHSKEFRDYIAHGDILFTAAEEFFKLLDTNLYQKDRGTLTPEETAQIQDQQTELNNAQQVAFEALKIFADLELKL